MIDKESHFDFICSGYKSLTDDQAKDKLNVSNRKATKGLSVDIWNEVKFIQGLLEGINPKNNTVTIVDIPNENEEYG